MTLPGTEIFSEPLGHRSGVVDRLTYLFLALALVSVTRIAMAQICLTLVLLCWLVPFLVRGQWSAFRTPPPMVPLLLFLCWNFVSAGFSLDPAFSVGEMGGLANLLVMLLFCNILDGEGDAKPLIQLVIIMGGMVALVGLGQYVIDDLGGVRHRITGPMSHYMTYSGILMLVDVMIIALLACTPARDRGRKIWWVWICLVLVTLALVMTYSRHAWVGLVAGIVVIAISIRSWKLVVVPMVLVALLVLAQGTLSERIQDIFDTSTNVSNIDRLNQLKSGLQMISDHPLKGVGPGMVEPLYPAYRTTQAVKEVTSHLHNTPVQLFAETGLVGLALWLWFVLRLFTVLGGRLQGMGVFSRRPAPAGRPWDRRLFYQLGSLAAAAAFFTAGLFEYNFGDTEVLVLFMFIISIAYSTWDRPEGRVPLEGRPS